MRKQDHEAKEDIEIDFLKTVKSGQQVLKGEKVLNSI